MRSALAIAVLVLVVLPIANDANATAVGEPCASGADCDGGTCLPAIDDPQVTYCTSACVRDDDCPGAMICKPTTDPDVDVCVHLAPTPGAVGWPCARDVECAAGRCLARAGAAASCTRACDAFGGADCPLGFTCQDLGFEHLCLAAPAAESGCAIASPRRRGPVALVASAAFVAALILARSWPRRRRSAS